MRKFLILGIAVVLGGAALLVPAGAQGAFGNGDEDKPYTGSSPSSINVNCAKGASTGTATFTVSISSPSGSAKETGKIKDGSIVVTRSGGVAVHTFYDWGSQSVTQGGFPCPTTSSNPGSVTFTFQPKTSGGSDTGTTKTSTSQTVRTGSTS